MIYQSMSGDADVGEATFSAEGGSITAKTGDMFYITNTDCEITLKDVAFTLAKMYSFAWKATLPPADGAQRAQTAEM